jgi:DNA-binding CsgD family transcriptional regulator
LIVSELAGNAIEHAVTDFDVTVSYTRAYLRVAVQDGGPALPPWMPDPATKPAASDRGLGLSLVDAIATAWNTTGITDGKIVWALLRVRPLGSPQGIDNPASGPPHQHGMVPLLADVASDHDDPAATPPGSSVRQLPMGQDLTIREAAVLDRLGTMLTVGEISAEMHVSVNTVKAHMRSVYRKLGVSHRRDAIVRANELGLLS